MPPAPVYLRACVLVCLFIYKALGGSPVTFTINDNGVQGHGTYTIINGVAEIGLKLVIRTTSEQANDNDSGTATITSLPPNTGPASTSLPSNIGPDSSVTPNNGPNTSLPPSTSLPSSNGAAQPTPEVTLTPEDNQFIDDMVADHNVLRSVHFSPPIQNNTQMSLAAKKLAIRLASEKDLRHSLPSERPNEGESLAMGCTTAPGQGISAAETIKKWYDEACCEDFSKNVFENISGHFSQLVWKATEEIGIGRAFGSRWGMNCTFVVARYKPKGNIDGDTTFKENVDKGTFDPMQYNCSDVIENYCPDKAGEESQVGQAPGNNQQENGLSDTSSEKTDGILQNKGIQSYSNMQRYRDLYYKNSKGISNIFRNRALNGYVKVPGINSNPLVSRYHGYRLNSVYSRDRSLPQFLSNDINEDEERPNSLEYRAKIPHNPIITQGDQQVVWFLL